MESGQEHGVGERVERREGLAILDHDLADRLQPFLLEHRPKQ